MSEAGVQNPTNSDQGSLRSESRIARCVSAVDEILRDPEGHFARVFRSLSPQTGHDYLMSREKRLLDLSVAVPAAIVSTPLVTSLGTAVKLEDGGSVFFVQERIGSSFRGEEMVGGTLDVIKLRCLAEGSDKGGDNITFARDHTPEEDPRNTRVGRFMPRFQLEELPQLFQVVCGQLSLLGIRPNTQYGFDFQREEWSEERFNEWVREYNSGPLGLSGLNQILARNSKDDRGRYHLDVFYTKNASLGLDLYLMWRTLVKLTGMDPSIRQLRKAKRRSRIRAKNQPTSVGDAS